jgi:hypothetical protein
MTIINNIEYLSDEGKVFQNKDTQDIMGWGICLGENDSIDNYIEIDCPEEYKCNKDYDNTVKYEKDIKSYKLHKEVKE